MTDTAKTPETKTHWKQLVDPRYLGAYSLPNGDDMTVTIDFVRLEEVTTTGGKKEDHSIMHLVGQKPMILNATNSKSIHRLYGPYIEDWAGKKVTLYASTAKLAGEVVECLRIRPEVAKPTITEDRFAKGLEAIKAKTYEAANMRKSFVLTTEQQQRLRDVEKELA